MSSEFLRASTSCGTVKFLPQINVRPAGRGTVASTHDLAELSCLRQSQSGVLVRTYIASAGTTFTGAGNSPVAPGCECADYDADDDADLDDYAPFAALLAP